MPILKCKICGGTLEFEQGATVGVCDSCGTKQTLPVTEDEILGNLFNRATTLRLKCEFDKAEELYGKILEKDPANAEAHWGVILCKYGIEYVEDPKTYRRVPTCHRTSFDAILADEDYKAALENADITGRELYETEAREIDRIQRDILSVVKDEKPFDVFICYKETDENGKRTQDSAIANDIYYQLTREGFKVFYAAITLEDKLGQEYEPYIFAALNSAKVMLVIGSKPEYYSAVWVKNEWSRYLKLMKTDRSKLLIPCYRDMDAYDLPEEFAHLQAQDMGKIGFINDVVRGIKKVIVKEEPPKTVETASGAQPSSAHNETTPLLKRIDLFLEDGEFDRADDFCEQVLNIDPENAEAYVGKLLAEFHIRKKSLLTSLSDTIRDNKNFQKALRFGDSKIREFLESAASEIEQVKYYKQCEKTYINAKTAFQTAKTKKEFEHCLSMFESVAEYSDSKSYISRCDEFLANDQKRIDRAVVNITEFLQIERRERDIIANTDAEKKKFLFERDNLGFFARKQASELDDKIKALQLDVQKHRIMYYDAIVNKLMGMQVLPLVDQISMSNLGEIISFGSYNDEPQKWIVLDIESDRVCLLNLGYVSIAGLSTDRNYEYNTCQIKLWLNNEYKKEHFTDQEQQAIVSVSLADKKMIESFLPKRIERQLWTVRNGSITYYPWWISNNGGFFGSASFVDNNGNISDFGKSIEEKLAIRPVIVASLK